MNTQEATQQITNKVNTAFSKFISNFSITLEEIHQGNAPLWKYSLSYKSQFADSLKSFSDAIQVGEINTIVKFVWSALCAEAQDTQGETSQVYKEIEARGVQLGFSTKDEEAR